VLVIVFADLIKINTPACLRMDACEYMPLDMAWGILFMLLHTAQFSPTGFTVYYSQKGKWWGMGRPWCRGGCISSSYYKIFMTAGHETQTSFLRELREWGDLWTWPKVRHEDWTSLVSVSVGWIICSYSWCSITSQPLCQHNLSTSSMMWL